MTDRMLAIIRCSVAAIIEIAGIIGFTLPISENTLYCVVAFIVMMAIFIYTAYKNHNFTESASQMQILLDAMKADDHDVIQAVEEIVEYINRESEDA